MKSTRNLLFGAAASLLVTNSMASGVAVQDLLVNDFKVETAERFFADASQVRFIEALSAANFELAENMLRQGMRVDFQGKRGLTPMIWALGKRDLKSVEFLLRNGSNPNYISCCDEESPGMVHQLSVIGLAARMPESEFLSTVLKNGGNPNLVVTESGEPSIFLTISEHRRANAELLIGAGADVNARNSASLMTPITLAVYGANFDMALLLLRSGADPSIKNRWGVSALSKVEKNGNAGVLENSADSIAYDEFIERLKVMGLLKFSPRKFPASR